MRPMRAKNTTAKNTIKALVVRRSTVIPKEPMYSTILEMAVAMMTSVNREIKEQIALMG